MRSFSLIALGVLAILLVLLWKSRSCPCDSLEVDQRNGVGTFVSFSETPLDPTSEPEVAPGLIRARSEDKVTWIIRNPSSQDIYVGLYDVREAGSTIDVKDELFPILDDRVLVPKNCGIAALQGQLSRDLIGEPARGDSCYSARQFFYNFYVWVMPTATSTGKGDTIVCEWPYDPELVVERDP
jgi:hypothetical protein